MPCMRCFVAVEIPEEVREGVEDLQGELRETGGDLNLVDPGQVHVTLKFLGDVEEERVPAVEEAVERAAAPVEPFEASYEGVGVFPSRSYVRVVWVGAEGSGFSELASNLEDEMADLGFEREDRDFVPHATIARVKSGRVKDRIVGVVDSHEGEGFGGEVVRDVRLKSSRLEPDGAVYGDVAVVEL